MDKHTGCLLSIVVVNWNSGNQLRDCISSIELAKQEGFSVAKVIVVDNGSNDGSFESIETLGVPLSVIRNAANLGFAAACNQGAAEAVGSYLLFLNPDAKLSSDCLIEPIRVMQANAEIGICGIRLIDDDGAPTTSAARFPTLRVLVGKTFGLSKLLPRIFPAHFMTKDELADDREVDQIIGAFFLIRRSLFQLCGGFDERFFVYFEEVDLSLRAKYLNHSSFYLSKPYAFHRGGGCSEGAKAVRLFYSLRSRILYAHKHFSNAEFIGVMFLTAAELPLRLALGIMRISPSDIYDTGTAYVKLILHFSKKALWR